MARTRATKGRPRPPSRSTITRVVPRRESTVEALRASITSIELDENKVKKTLSPLNERRAHCSTDLLGGTCDAEENTVKIKKEEDDDDMVDAMKVAAWPKRRAQDTSSKAPATKKQKPSPPSSTTRTTRSKTLTSRTKPDSIRSDTDTKTHSESEHESKLCDSTIKNIGSYRKNGKMSFPNSPLDLLRPYMAFQLSVSGLSGKAYKAAQASMASVLDVAEHLEKHGSSALIEARNSPNSSVEDRKTCVDRENIVDGKEKQVGKSKRKTEEDVLPRKQRELNEQTRKRLEREKRRKETEGEENGGEITTHLSSSSSTSSDAATEVASDTDDEAKYPPTKALSVLSTTSSYQSLHRSTDSVETSSEGEESDVIERREKNALRRRKARQQRRNVRKRKERKSESGSESEPQIEMDITGRKESERRTPVLANLECGKEVVVDFLPVAW